MGSNNSLAAYWRKQFTLSKLTFHIIFHGIHIAMFIIGWYAFTKHPILFSHAPPSITRTTVLN